MISVRQVKAARALLAWSQADLARASQISEPTVARLESADGELGGRSGTAEAIRQALESAGVEFIAENGGGAGVRLRKPTESKFIGIDPAPGGVQNQVTSQPRRPRGPGE